MFIPSRVLRGRVDARARNRASATGGYQPQLDGLRAVAVAVVMAYHAAIPFAVGGYVGVDVFFVLSGFLITSLLLRERARSWSHQINLGGFYLRRARRLLPALFAMLAVTFVAYHLIGRPVPSTGETIRGVPASLFYVANWLPALGIANLGYLGHMWSLSVEEHFYLLWPMLLGVLWSRNPSTTARRIAVACVLATVYRVGLIVHGAGANRLYAGTDARAEELLVGCLLAASMAAGLPRVAGAYGRVSTAVAALGGAALAAVCVWLPVHASLLPRGGSTVIELAAAAVIGHLVLHPQTRGARLLACRPAVWVGRRSYGLYLWHLPLWGLMTGLVHVGSPVTRVVSTVAVWAATGGCAALSYRYIERPWLARRAGDAIDLRDQTESKQPVDAHNLAAAV